MCTVVTVGAGGTFDDDKEDDDDDEASSEGAFAVFDREYVFVDEVMFGLSVTMASGNVIGITFSITILIGCGLTTACGSGQVSRFVTVIVTGAEDSDDAAGMVNDRDDDDCDCDCGCGAANKEVDEGRVSIRALLTLTTRLLRMNCLLLDRIRGRPGPLIPLNPLLTGRGGRPI